MPSLPFWVQYLGWSSEEPLLNKHTQSIAGMSDADILPLDW